MDWYYYKKALLPTSEIHLDIHINKKEATTLLKKNSAWFLRYTNEFDKKKDSAAFYVIKDNWGGLAELSANTRNQVRKSLKNCTVQKIEKEVLLNEGYIVFANSFDNYKIKKGKKISKEDFYSGIIKLEKEEIFGCFDKLSGSLIAYSINIVGEGIQYSSAKANPEFYKSHYPFYALFYKMNEYYLETCKIKYVSDGFRTLDSHSNIQSFLIEKFKFRKAYCNLHVQYRWWLGIVVGFLYPFRKYIKFRLIQSLLFQEEISRLSLNATR